MRFTDAFDRAAASDLGPDWYVSPGFVTSGSETAVVSGAAVVLALRVVAPDTADQSMKVTLVNNSGTSTGVLTRAAQSGAANNTVRGYLSRHTGSELAILRCNADGSFTSLVSASHTRVAGQTLELRSRGNQHTAYINGAPIITVLDSTWLDGGTVGMRAFTNGTTLDNAEGGDLPALVREQAIRDEFDGSGSLESTGNYALVAGNSFTQSGGLVSAPSGSGPLTVRNDAPSQLTKTRSTYARGAIGTLPSSGTAGFLLTYNASANSSHHFRLGQAQWSLQRQIAGGSLATVVNFTNWTYAVGTEFEMRRIVPPAGGDVIMELYIAGAMVASWIDTALDNDAASVSFVGVGVRSNNAAGAQLDWLESGYINETSDAPTPVFVEAVALGVSTTLATTEVVEVDVADAALGTAIALSVEAVEVNTAAASLGVATTLSVTAVEVDIATTSLGVALALSVIAVEVNAATAALGVTLTLSAVLADSAPVFVETVTLGVTVGVSSMAMKVVAATPTLGVVVAVTSLAVEVNTATVTLGAALALSATSQLVASDAIALGVVAALSVDVENAGGLEHLIFRGRQYRALYRGEALLYRV
jgi:hypothetical protein